MTCRCSELCSRASSASARASSAIRRIDSTMPRRSLVDGVVVIVDQPQQHRDVGWRAAGAQLQLAQLRPQVRVQLRVLLDSGRGSARTSVVVAPGAASGAPGRVRRVCGFDITRAISPRMIIRVAPVLPREAPRDSVGCAGSAPAWQALLRCSVGRGGGRGLTGDGRVRGGNGCRLVRHPGPGDHGHRKGLASKSGRRRPRSPLPGR